MTRVADTSFLMACFDERDGRRPQALSWLADSTPIVVPPEVASETFGIVHARRGFAAALAVLEDLSRLEHVRFADDTSHNEIAKLFRGVSTNLTWVDWAVVWRARKHGWPVLCYDPAIEREAKKTA